jgi:hypothetical protein
MIMAGMWQTHRVVQYRETASLRNWMVTPYVRRDGAGLMVGVVNF